MRALVIVHLSSLDAYTEMHPDREAGTRLSRAIAERVHIFRVHRYDSILVLDEKWEYEGWQSDPRMYVYKAIAHKQERPWVWPDFHVLWFDHSDDYEGAWTAGMEPIYDALRPFDQVHLAGAWASTGWSGCVNSVERKLRRRGWTVKRIRECCGYEDDVFGAPIFATRAEAPRPLEDE